MIARTEARVSASGTSLPTPFSTPRREVPLARRSRSSTRSILTSTSPQADACINCGGVLTGRPDITAKDPKPWTFVETSCGTRHHVVAGRGTARQWAGARFAGPLVAITMTTLANGDLATIRVSEVPYLVPTLWHVTARVVANGGLRPFGDVVVSEVAHDLDLALEFAQSLAAQIAPTQDQEVSA